MSKLQELHESSCLPGLSIDTFGDLGNRVRHTEPYPGDNGKRFTPKFG